MGDVSRDAVRKPAARAAAVPVPEARAAVSLSQVASMAGNAAFARAVARNRGLASRLQRVERVTDPDRMEVDQRVQDLDPDFQKALLEACRELDPIPRKSAHMVVEVEGERYRLSRWEYQWLKRNIQIGVPEEVNTFDLTTNCYYVTAAKLAGITVAALIAKTEELQVQGGATIEEIKRLCDAAGFADISGPYPTLADAEAEMGRLADGRPTDFGLGCEKPSAVSHFVVAKHDGFAEVRYVDYQHSAAGAEWPASDRGGSAFWIMSK